MRNTGFRIGRLFGIEVRVDWSWLFIFFLVTWNLSAIFGETNHWPTTLRWSIAVIAALLFFASVLAHELAHSLVARAKGVPVRGITLFLFGGVSNLRREPDSPGAEFLMAIVGPLTSIIIGGLLLLLARVIAGPVGNAMANPAQAIVRLGPAVTLLAWLGSVNVVVGLFNLTPGFPLDGGRVLRSILWAFTRNLRRATRWAAGVGQAIAWLMVIGGIAMIFGATLPFFGTGFSSGLWLAFIGWFLNNAASQSYQQVVIQDILEDVPVSRLMRIDPPFCKPSCTVSELVHNHVMGSDDHGFPVLDGSLLVGLVTLDDVRKVTRDLWETTSVRDIMTPAVELVVVGPEDDVAEALNRLAQRDVHQLPVMKGNDLVGLLRRRDIIRYLQLHSTL